MADEVSPAPAATKKRGGGLTMPANPARALQEMMQEEMRRAPGGGDPAEVTPATPSKEEMKVSSNEGRLEGEHVDTMAPVSEPSSARVGDGTSEGAHERTSARGNAPLKEGTRNGTSAPSQEGAGEGWLDDVLIRAKGEASGGRLTRLNVDIDEDLHFRLKEHCLRNRITLRKLVPVLLEAYLEQTED